MAKALCVNCGHVKAKPYVKCGHCGFDPTQSEEALVRSVYLSTGRYQEPHDAEEYASELDRIGEGIRRGESVEYDAHELERLRLQKRMVSHVTFRPLCGVLLRFFLPGVIFLLILWVAFYVLSWLAD